MKYLELLQRAERLSELSKDLPEILPVLNELYSLFCTDEFKKKLLEEVSKSEEGNIESLEKAFRRGAARFKGRTHTHYPVGTRVGRRKKVLVDGKEVWRSMASGQVKDDKGAGISVRSSNFQAQGKGGPAKAGS